MKQIEQPLTSNIYLYLFMMLVTYGNRKSKFNIFFHCSARAINCAHCNAPVAKLCSIGS